MQQNKKKALFLYFELSGYFVSCLEKLVEQYNIEAHVVRLPVNPLAPFNFESRNNIFYYERKDYDSDSLLELTKKISPDFIYCSGWSDKGYMHVSKKMMGKTPTVLTFDNPWHGTFKQHIASITAPFVLPNYFSHCWVPGKPQVTYAKKLGFKDNQIFTGMYSANTELFDSFYKSSIGEKEKKFPHRFLYVGRYIEIKGIYDTWKSFVEFQEETPSDWELWCIGKGENPDEFPKHPKIKDIGFVQPSELIKYINQTGVFVLSSLDEHWGVVVHEFACAGYPLLCSQHAQAATTFLKEGVNGYMHETSNIEHLKNTYRKFVALSDEQLIEMAHQSHKISKTITPETWSNTVWNFCNIKNGN